MKSIQRSRAEFVCVGVGISCRSIRSHYSATIRRDDYYLVHLLLGQLAALCGRTFGECTLAPALGVSFKLKNHWTNTPRWGLIVGGAAIMSFGQIALIVVGSWFFGAPPAHEIPFANRSIELRLFVIVVAMPFVETIVGQWLPIRLVRGVFRQPWWVAGLCSAIAFTCLHGYTDRTVVSIVLGAAVLAAVFVVEARKQGRPIFSTYVTHALANGLVLAVRFL